MKRYITILALLLTFVSVASAQSIDRETPYYGDAYWGIDRQGFSQAARQSGYSKAEDDLGEGMLGFSGKTVLGEDTGIIGYFSPEKGLVKAQVIFLTADKDARDFYAKLASELTKKFGKPAEEYGFFQDPYYEGDGYEDQAIRLGKGHFATIWDYGDGSVYINITENLTVNMSYESKYWSDELSRRNSESLSDF